MSFTNRVSIEADFRFGFAYHIIIHICLSIIHMYSEGTRMQGIFVRKKGYHFSPQKAGRCPCQRIKDSSPGFAFNMCGHARHVQANWKYAPSRLDAYLPGLWYHQNICKTRRKRIHTKCVVKHLLGAGLRYSVIAL